MNGNTGSNGHKSPTPPSKAKWTVMVYLAGDNNLTANCITVLQQLEAVKYDALKNTDEICVLACFDSNTPWPKGSRYLAINGKRIKNDEHLNWEIYNDLIITQKRGHAMTVPDFCGCGCDEVKGVPMKKTDVAVGLKRFLDWAMMQRPSDHYMLVLYGHGPVVAGNTFLIQDNPVSSVRMKDLPEILSAHFCSHRKLDILAFQNCAMNGVETAYEVRDQVDYLIGSQGLVLAYGWPYDKMIGEVVANPTDSPRNITEKIMKACARHLIDFSVMDRSSEQSACDLSKFRSGTNLTEAIQKLGSELQQALVFTKARVPGKPKQTELKLKYPDICDAVRLARLEAQSYWDETFVDIYDFCERLLQKCRRASVVHYDLIRSLGFNGSLQGQLRKSDFVTRLRKIIECCKQVMDRVEEMVPYSYYIGAELQYSHGLSIYFPWSLPREPYSFYEQGEEHILVTAFETYSRYEFCVASGWHEFLRSFYKATLRNVRRAERKFKVRRVTDDLSFDMVSETYTPRNYVVTTDYLQKTDSGGIADADIAPSIKNYPRRNYLSPADCPRKIDKGGRFVPREIPVYPNSQSTPVSYLGWNICQFVADVIVKKTPPGKGTNGTGAKARSRQKQLSKQPPKEAVRAVASGGRR